MRHLKLALTAVAAASALFGAAFAHFSMKASNIAANAVIETLPEKFTMSFTQRVGLASFKLETGAPGAQNCDEVR